VVDDLLTVARGVASSKETACLNDLVRSYLESPEYHNLLLSCDRLRCETRLDPGLENFYCSPVHVRKCLMNLVANGAEAMDGDGVIVITTRNEELTRADGEREAGRYVVLTVADNGPGIAEEDLDHIFEPVYTRKVMGTSGTGLGLTVVWNTVEDHGGTISVESSDRGTVFRLYFPATSALVIDQPESEDLEELRGAGQLVLVVDDEEQQRDIARRILEMLGYRVMTAASGEEALALLKGRDVDLVVLDMVLGSGMNGLETYREMLAARPGQKAVIASGYAENSDVSETLSLGASAFIKKPYSITALGRVVRDALGEN
jgi:CheY-like chemotaxis protein